jgi:iron(III) transport system substrate-binding protein
VEERRQVMTGLSRREFVTLLGMLAGTALTGCGSPTGAPAPAQAPAPQAGACPNPTEVHGFLTCADVKKAEQEGAIVPYSSEIERQLVQFMGEFGKLFPKIDTSKYSREQIGRVYAKLTAERQAGTYLADVLSSSDVAISMDFMKRGGYVQYVSPYLKDYDSSFQSNPPGYFTWYSLILAGIAYNTNLVPESEAPRSWKDLLDPRWRGSINFKDSASGLQSVQWFMLKKLYGDQFWKDMAAQNPKGLASTTQQYERLINGEDKVIGLAQYNNYLEFKQRGAPINFVIPPEGLVVTPFTIGIVDRAPHPEAAKLFVDWLLSPVGQQAYVRITYYHSARKDVPPPPGAKPLSELKLLIPDWEELASVHSQYVREWNALTGLR